MTYATEAARLGREPLVVYEADLDFCANAYADGTCAAGSVHTGTAQAGAASTVTLDTGASAVDDAYNTMNVLITGGTGSGQVRNVSAYVGATKVATVSVAWTINPDATSTFSVINPNASDACCNTRNTCQDTANWSRTTKTYRFCQDRSNLPVGIDMFPCVMGEADTAPMKITPGKGLGYRAAISIKLQDFPHHDRGIDPYVSNRTYTPETQGTFFGKWLARNIYYEGRQIRVLSGYITDPFDWANFKTETYIIDDVIGPTNGVVQIKAKDILALADDKKAQMPALSKGKLSGALTAVATSFTLTANAGEYVTGKYLRMGSEIVGPVTVSGTSITNATRATWGTTAATHSDGDLVQVCEAFEAVNVVDILDYTFNTYVSKFDTSWLPYDQGISGPATGTNDEWDDEKANWWSAHDLTGIISKPEGIGSIVAEVLEQCLGDIWWDAKNSKLKLKAVAPELGNATIQSINEAEHIIADSVVVKNDVKARLSRVIVHYEKLDHTGDDKASNYGNASGQIEAEKEDDNHYGTIATKEIFSRWFSNGNAGQAVQLQGRLLARLSDTPKVVDFELDAKDDLTPVGSRIEINSSAIQGATGATEAHELQIVQRNEVQQGHRVKYQGITSQFSGRYGFIAPNGTPDYSAATDDERQRYAFICLNTGLFADGTSGYKII